jgi:pimeloyl-ACP methyl ester carboxylesterase
MKSGKVELNGQIIYWESHGEGIPLILVMGIGYDATLWDLHQVLFFSKYFQTITFDNRDVGRSSMAGNPYTISDMADDLLGLMDELNLKKAHLLGLSMGGMICLDFAIRYPERINKLILTGTGAANKRSKFDPISVWSFVKSNDMGGYNFAAQQFIWLFSNNFLRNHQAVDQTLQLLASNPNPVSKESFQRQANAYINFDVLDKLSYIKAPTLMISGEQDILTPPWICREVADGITRSKFHLVTGDGSSHALPLERPDDFNKIAFDFLKE